METEPLDKGIGFFHMTEVVVFSFSVPLRAVVPDIPLIVVVTGKRTDPEFMPKTPFGLNLNIVTTIRRVQRGRGKKNPPVGKMEE